MSIGFLALKVRELSWESDARDRTDVGGDKLRLNAAMKDEIHYHERLYAATGDPKPVNDISVSHKRHPRYEKAIGSLIELAAKHKTMAVESFHPRSV